MSCQNKVVFEFTSFSLFWQDIAATSGAHQFIFGIKRFNIMIHGIIVRFIVLLFFCLISTNALFSQERKEVSVTLNMSPQARFAGFYVARELGIYEKHALQTRIVHTSSDTMSTDSIVSGKADFSIVSLPSAIQLRANGVKLINLSQIAQSSALMIVAGKSSGISRITDLHNRTLGIYADKIHYLPRLLSEKYNINITVLPHSRSPALFLRDGVDSIMATLYNTYHLLLSSGLDSEDINIFFMDESDLDFPGDGIYIMESKQKVDRNVCINFITATLEGWRYAFDHPEESIKIVIKEMLLHNMPAGVVHQEWMLKHYKDIVFPKISNSTPGHLKKDDYTRLADALHKAKIIRRIPDYTKFYVEVAHEE